MFALQVIPSACLKLVAVLVGAIIRNTAIDDLPSVLMPRAGPEEAKDLEQHSLRYPAPSARSALSTMRSSRLSVSVPPLV